MERKQVAVLQMINAHRFLGVRIADLDPLAVMPSRKYPSSRLPITA